MNKKLNNVPSAGTTDESITNADGLTSSLTCPKPVVSSSFKSMLKDVCNQFGFMVTQKILICWTYEIEGEQAAINLIKSIRKNCC